MLKWNLGVFQDWASAGAGRRYFPRTCVKCLIGWPSRTGAPPIGSPCARPSTNCDGQDKPRLAAKLGAAVMRLSSKCLPNQVSTLRIRKVWMPLGLMGMAPSI